MDYLSLTYIDVRNKNTHTQMIPLCAVELTHDTNDTVMIVEQVEHIIPPFMLRPTFQAIYCFPTAQEKQRNQ